MDSRQFDSLTRVIATGSTRRTFIWRGAAVLGIAGSLSRFESASAARRGSNVVTAICRPDGAGGYYRDSVQTVVLQAALNSGAIISDCCAHAECGVSNGCMDAYCDFAAGACSISMYNGAACARPGCADGYCSGGVCNDPLRPLCGASVCNNCTYDSCAHECNCVVKACYTDDYQCMDAYCDPAQGGCVTEPLNEGAFCNTNGVEGICALGYCTES